MIDREGRNDRKDREGNRKKGRRERELNREGER